MTKKKDYLHKAEQGVLIGTSFLLLNGLASCSFEPMDTPPTEPTLTKGPGGLPGGLPGQSITYYPAGQSPLLYENQKAGFIMTEGYCTFMTKIPAGYTGLAITMNENESGYVRKISNVEAPGCQGFSWNKASDLLVNGLNKTSADKNISLKIYSTDKASVILYFRYTK